MKKRTIFLLAALAALGVWLYRFRKTWWKA